jgi:hypothetical protein
MQQRSVDLHLQVGKLVSVNSFLDTFASKIRLPQPEDSVVLV